MKKNKTKKTLIDLKKIPRIEDDVIFRKNADKTVSMMRVDCDDHFFSVDGIAVDLWLSIDGKTSLEKIQKKLEGKHKPPTGKFQRDFIKMIGSLKKEKLIVLS